MESFSRNERKPYKMNKTAIFGMAMFLPLPRLPASCAPVVSCILIFARETSSIIKINFKIDAIMIIDRMGAQSSSFILQ